jgi:hypothetical protein
MATPSPLIADQNRQRQAAALDRDGVRQERQRQRQHHRAAESLRGARAISQLTSGRQRGGGRRCA